ncbi:hypothetical protein HDV06_001995 [Boothiomyces sp. JEL0866]|nr:hypothetical protein HDV06_001995 [Boothiomyces sp. JEL0866]
MNIKQNGFLEPKLLGKGSELMENPPPLIHRSDEMDVDAELEGKTPASSTKNTSSLNRVRKSLPRNAKTLTSELAEFVIHALIRLWDEKGVAPSVQTKIFGNWREGDMVSPAGYEDVYPKMVQNFLELLRRTDISLSIILCALLYVFRVRQSIKGNVGKGTQYQVLITAIILSQKMNSDERYSNSAWSKVVPYTTEQINNMERQFFAQLGNRLFIKKEHYESWTETMQTLGKERNIVKSALAMPPDEQQKLYATLHKRPDLIQEIQWIIQNRKLKNSIPQFDSGYYSQDTNRAAADKFAQGLTNYYEVSKGDQMDDGFYSKSNQDNSANTDNDNTYHNHY